MELLIILAKNFKKIKIYAPPDVKSYGLNSDGTLTITGIASTTNEDLDGEIVSKPAIESLARQVIGLNLLLDHNHHYDGGLGVIKDGELLNNGSSLRITADILPEYAEGIKQRLDLGMNFGFSIGGIPLRDPTNPYVFNDFKLLEVTLTLLPANWDTFGTVETKNFVESTCLTGACHYILKTESDTMSKKDLTRKEITDEVKQEMVNMINETINELRPVLIDEIKNDIGAMVKDIVTETLQAVLPQDEIEPEETGEEEEVVVEEEKEVEEDIIEEEADNDETADEIVDDEDIVEIEESAEESVEDPLVEDSEEEDDEEVVEEEKDIDDPLELTEEPVIEEETEDEEEKTDAPKVIVDIKSIASEIKEELKKSLTKEISEDIIKSFNTKNKKTKKTPSKLETFKNTKKTVKKSRKFLGSDTRDEFGRNKKFMKK